jgi:heme/copper-type cytochrome/quinol oxidase subunit 1
MALTEASPESDQLSPSAVAGAPRQLAAPAVQGVLGGVDHVTTGRMFVGLALVFGALDLVVSALVNFNISATDSGGGEGFLSAELAQRVAQNQTIGFVLCCALPLMLGLAIIIVPKQVGSPTLSFPRAAALSLWTWLLTSVVFVVVVAADGSYGGSNEKLARLGNVATGALIVSLCIGVVCVAATVLTLRPSGMRLADVPFFSFSMIVAATAWVLTLPAVVAHVVLVHIITPGPGDLQAAFDDGISWMFSQPTVYIVLIPMLGLAVDVASTAAGSRQRGRGAVLFAIGLAGALTFGAWAQTEAARATVIWVLMSALFAVPIIAVLGAMGDTFQSSRPKLISPLAFVIVAMLLGLVGSMVGLLEALDSTGKGRLIGLGTAALNTGLFHLVIGAAITAGLGGCFYWARQSFGDSLPESAGRLLAPAALVGVSLWGLPYLLLGIMQANDEGTDPRVFAAISGAGALLMSLVLLVTIAAGIQVRTEVRRGDVLVADPWGGAGTLEWAAAESVPTSVESPYPLLDAEGDD